MERLLLILLVLSNVALATAVFMVLAKPDLGISFVLRRTGVRDDWFEEHVGPQELARLRTLMKYGSWAGLALLFGWSFFVGVAMTLLRL